MKFRFTELVDRLQYPSIYRAKLSMIHSDILAYAESCYDGTSVTKIKIVDALNMASYYVISGEDIPSSWNPDVPLDNIPYVSAKTCRDKLDKLYLVSSSIIWDINIQHIEPSIVMDNKGAATLDIHSMLSSQANLNSTETSPEDLMIEGPLIPRIDITKIWRSGEVDGRKYCIYTSLPEVPTTQSEISVTTDIKLMQRADFLKLYPNQVFYTRPPEMYAELGDIEVDPILGAILPISGYTRDQLVNNIIQYPYLANILREGRADGVRKLVPFYSRIEIDGQLYKTADVWEDIPEMKHLPKNKAIMQEYVVRRYLLERDESNIHHNYDIYGTLYPYLTLFMPISKYIEFGYEDVQDIAMQCVKSRISYKQSRNPVIRRLDEFV